VDILEALANEAPPNTTGKCKIQRWLDSIEADRPGRAQLIATVETPYDTKDESTRTLQQTARVLNRLGLHTTYLSVGNHRAGRCSCGD
jgi:hypothetical protein